jgi:hypothetical protein
VNFSRRHLLASLGLALPAATLIATEAEAASSTKSRKHTSTKHTAAHKTTTPHKSTKHASAHRRSTAKPTTQG